MPEDLMLVICSPAPYMEVTTDYWEDGVAEDGRLPSELLNALKEFNAIIKTLPADRYIPSDIRTPYNSE